MIGPSNVQQQMIGPPNAQQQMIGPPNAQQQMIGTYNSVFPTPNHVRPPYMYPRGGTINTQTQLTVLYVKFNE